MIQYIDKSALVAELERVKEFYENIQKLKPVYESNIEDCNDLLSFIDTLEVKEVDLKKEIREYLSTYWPEEKELHPFLGHIAKHFFELGLRVNNPITAADRGMAEEIIINLKRVEQDYHIDLTRYMEWLRNLMKKGE